MIPYYEKQPDNRFFFNWAKGEPGWAPHLHPQLEIVYVKKGFADVTIDNHVARLHQGDMALVFPHCVHSYQLTKDDISNHFAGLRVTTDLTGIFEDRLLHHLPENPFFFHNSMDEETRFTVQRLFTQDPKPSCELTQSYLQLLLALIWPQLNVKQNDHRQEGMPHRIIRYVMEHCHQPLQAKEVADALNISSSHLARLFSRHLRMGFNEYVNQLRVQHAADMLRSSDEPITEIMAAVGFNSQSTFNRVFRQEHGINPRDYRRQNRPKRIVTNHKKKEGRGNDLV